MLDAQATCLRASESSISASIEFSRTADALDMHQLLDRFDGILRDIGEKTRSTRQTHDCEAAIETLNFEFNLTRLGDKLKLTVRPREHSVVNVQGAQEVMTRLLRAAFPAIRPVRIHFQGAPSEVDLDRFMAGDVDVRPRRPTKRRLPKKNRDVRPVPIQVPGTDRVSDECSTAPAKNVTPSRPTLSKDARHSSALAQRRPVVYGSTPNLPALAPQHEITEDEKRLKALRKSTIEDAISADACNRHEPEATWRVVLAWAITGVTASQFLPAAAAMAALNVLKGTNLRINALAMCLTATAVLFYETRYAMDAVALLELLARESSTQAIEALRMLLG